MPQRLILSVQSSAGGVVRSRNVWVGARRSVYRHEVIEALTTCRAVSSNRRVSDARGHRAPPPRDARRGAAVRLGTGPMRRENG
jgi:hypothetical protein